MESNQTGFRASIFRALRFERNSSKDKSAPSLTIAETLKALVHITTTVSINQGVNLDQGYKVPKISDYVYVVFSFLMCTLVVSSAASLGSYLLLTLSQNVISSLSYASLAGLYRAILIKQAAEIATRSTKFILALYDKYIQNVTMMYVKNFMAEHVGKVKDNDSFIRAQTDINAAIAHISVIINYVVFVVVFGAYALMHLDPLMVLMALGIGGIAKSFNKGLSCIYKIVSERAIDVSNKASTDAAGLLSHDRFMSLVRIKALSQVTNRLKVLNQRVFESEWSRQAWAALIEFFSGVVKSITENAYYLYFGAAIAKGYISPMQVIILLPYIEQVSECSAKLCNLPILSSHMRNGMANLQHQWNEIVAPELKIKSETSEIFRFSRKEMLIYSVFISGLLPWLIPLFSQASVKAIITLLFVWPMTTMVKPSALSSQILMYLMTVIEYPLSCVYAYVTSSHKRDEQHERVTPSNQVVQFPEIFQREAGGKELSFKLDDLEVGKPIQVEQRTGGGKTTLFGHRAYDVIQQAMHVTGNRDLIIDRESHSYLECLANTHGIPKDSIERVVNQLLLNNPGDQALIDMSKKMHSNAECAQLSTGQQEALSAIAATCSAIDKKCQYVCFDDALNGTSGNIRDKIYAYIIEALKGIRLVIVHPDYEVKGCSKVTANENQNRCNFTACTV